MIKRLQIRDQLLLYHYLAQALLLKGDVNFGLVKTKLVIEATHSRRLGSDSPTRHLYSR